MEITANALQTVNANQNVLFTDTSVYGNCSIVHREGSGLVVLRGITTQCRARYKVSFGGNVAIPTGGAVAAISLALALDGEPIGPTTMIATPAAIGDFWNVHGEIFIDVPKGCCYTITVQNIGAAAIEVQNANLIVERVA